MPRRSRRGSIDEDRRNEFLRIILSDSDRLLATIEQILRSGRVRGSSRKPHLVPIDLDEVVSECVTRARISNDLPPEALQYQPRRRCRFCGDAEEVRAAVSNLIDNAVKYSVGEVKVEVTAAAVGDGLVELRVQRSRDPASPNPS